MHERHGNNTSAVTKLQCWQNAPQEAPKLREREGTELTGNVKTCPRVCISQGGSTPSVRTRMAALSRGSKGTWRTRSQPVLPPGTADACGAHRLDSQEICSLCSKLNFLSWDNCRQVQLQETTQRDPRYHFLSFPKRNILPNYTGIISQAGGRYTDADGDVLTDNPPSSSDFPALTSAHVCVCVFKSVGSVTCVGPCTHQHGQHTEPPSPQGPLCHL